MSGLTPDYLIHKADGGGGREAPHYSSSFTDLEIGSWCLFAACKNASEAWLPNTP